MENQQKHINRIEFSLLTEAYLFRVIHLEALDVKADVAFFTHVQRSTCTFWKSAAPLLGFHWPVVQLVKSNVVLRLLSSHSRSLRGALLKVKINNGPPK